MNDDEHRNSAHMRDGDLLNSLRNSPTDDRTIAIIYVSYIEKYLGEVIKTRLPGLNSNLKATMFAPEGALGSFGRRNQFAKALNIIDGEVFANIKILASIRNKFAHNLEFNSFEHDEILKAVNKMTWGTNLEKFPAGGWTKETADQARSNYLNSSPRSKFDYVAGQMTIMLHNFINGVWHGKDLSRVTLTM